MDEYDETDDWTEWEFIDDSSGYVGVDRGNGSEEVVYVVYDLCRYCGKSSPEFDICPRCGAPYSERQ